tara:strand:+ start:87 stop:416 length:330 start_codon:yes stop_codon:yes gene_type:complete
VSLEQYKDASRKELWDILQIQMQVLQAETAKVVELEKFKDYYQELVQARGYYGITDLLAADTKHKERIAELEKALSDLIERAAQRDSWKYFPQSYLDEAFKVLLKEQGK